MLQNSYQQENSEHVELATLQERVQMCKSEPFKELKSFIQGLVDEAHESIVGCVSGEPKTYMQLSIRYQQRIAVKRAIDLWQENAEKGVAEITESMRKDLERMSYSQEEWLEGVEY